MLDDWSLEWCLLMTVVGPFVRSIIDCYFNGCFRLRNVQRIILGRVMNNVGFLSLLCKILMVFFGRVKQFMRLCGHYCILYVTVVNFNINNIKWR